MTARLGDHPGVRASTLLVTVLLLALACGGAGEPGQADAQARAQAPQVGSGAAAPSESPDAAAEAIAQLEAADGPQGAGLQPTAPDQDAPAVDEAAPAPGEAPVEPEPPADPLAPILPSGPEPGSPEADAELAELLEESTLTQEEFDAAFRKSKPKIDGDQFVFGPGDRTRKRPVVEFGTPTITGAKLAATELLALAKADLREFEGCLAVALSDEPSLTGSLTLSVRFDAAGEAESGGAKAASTAISAPLRSCIAAVADDWRLAAAAGASVELPLKLRGE